MLQWQTFNQGQFLLTMYYLSDVMWFYCTPWQFLGTFSAQLLHLGRKIDHVISFRVTHYLSEVFIWSQLTSLLLNWLEHKYFDMSDHQSLTKTSTSPKIVEVPSTLLSVIKIVGVYGVNKCIVFQWAENYTSNNLIMRDVFT